MKGVSLDRVGLDYQESIRADCNEGDVEYAHHHMAFGYCCCVAQLGC